MQAQYGAPQVEGSKTSAAITAGARLRSAGAADQSCFEQGCGWLGSCSYFIKYSRSRAALPPATAAAMLVPSM